MQRAELGDRIKSGWMHKNSRGGHQVRWSFRNLFALVVWGSIVATWVLHGSGAIQLPEQVIGAEIVIAQTTVFFYFRKKGPEEKPEG